MLNDENSIPIQPSMVSLAKEIYDYIEKRRKEIKSESNQRSAPVVVNAKSPAEQIKEYKELLDMGIITEEEFDVKKKQLLDL